MIILRAICELIFLCCLADSWPQVLDDSAARQDWNWKPKYDIDALVDVMVREIKEMNLKNQ